MEGAASEISGDGGGCHDDKQRCNGEQRRREANTEGAAMERTAGDGTRYDREKRRRRKPATEVCGWPWSPAMEVKLDGEDGEFESD
jgi:hypothetical protein